MQESKSQINPAMMKIFSRRSLSRKLIWCRDLILCESETLFTRKRYKLEEKGEEEEAKGGGEGGGEEEQEDKEGEDEEGEGGNDNEDIKDLPDDVMQAIMQRLPLSDYLHCRDVSPCWRAQIDSKRWLPAAHQLPWLLSNHYMEAQTFYIKTHVDDADFGDYCYSFVRDRRFSKSNIIDNIDTYYYFWFCGGEIEGWLLMVSHTYSLDNSLFLLNPATAARVMLPLRHHPSPLIRKVVASSVPTTSKCFVTCLHFGKSNLLAFCMPSDRTWTLIEAEKPLQISDIEILDGRLYAVGIDVLNFLMVFDIQLDTNDSRLHTYSSQRLVTLHPTIKSIHDIGVSRRNFYLAKCSKSKDLFMILYNQDPCTPYQRNEFEFEGLFQVLKLDYSVTTGPPQWVEIEDFGDRALFMGTRNSIFITPHDKTLERNCIYFALWKQGRDGKELYSGVFSLTDRSIKPMTIPKHYPYREANETIWFTPTPWN